MDDVDQLLNVRRCPEKACAVLPGGEHVPECALAVCLLTGEQRILHLDDQDETFRIVAGLPENGVDGHDCGADVWTGEQNGAADCRRFGWYVRLGRGRARQLGWIPCPPDHPDAQLDFYRLWTDAAWCPVEKRWTLREETVGGPRG